MQVINPFLISYYTVFALLIISYLLTHIFISTDNPVLYFSFLGITGLMIIVLFTLKFFIKS